MFATPTLAVLTVTGILLVIASILLTWRFSRVQKKNGRQTVLPATTPQPRRPDGRYAEQKHAARLTPTRDERIKEGIGCLSRALLAARRGDFAAAHAQLHATARLLETDPTAALWLGATRGLINALDENHGLAGREITTTLERMSAQWPYIDGGARTYQQIAELCSEAMRHIPTHKLGTDGAEADALIEQARQHNTANNNEAALACLTQAEEVIARSTTMKWNITLRKEIRRAKWSLSRATIAYQNKNHNLAPAEPYLKEGGVRLAAQTAAA